MNNPAATPITILALTPPFIPLQTLPITHPTAHVGLSIGNYYKDPLGLVVLFGPWQGQALYEVVDLLLNGAPTPVASEIVMDDSKAVVLRLPLGLLTDGPNTLKCTVKRQSGNEDSVDLIVLYSVNAPAGEDFDTGAGHSRLSIDVTPKSIGPGEAAHGVTLEMNYPHKRLYDTLTVDCGGQTIKHQIVPTTQDPNPETKSVVLTLFAAEFAKDPNNPQFPIRYSVVSQEGNFSGTSPVGQFTPHDHWSQLCLIDVHLDRVELEMPILQEVLGDNNDDPAIIDLAKLNGGPLWALIHLIQAIWQAGDQIHLAFTAEINGSVVATDEATLPITHVPGQFAWDIPNNKVTAGSTVKVHYEQFRGDKVIGTSKVATAQVIGQSAPNVEVTFTNAPYTVAPKGRVTDIQLRLMQAGQPISGTITVTLPADTFYADGTGGARDFKTQSDGTLTVSGVTAAATSGTFWLTVSSSRDTKTSTLTVTGHGPVGPIVLGGVPTGVTLSLDGTRAYVCGAHRISEIDTANSQVIRTFDDTRLDVSWEAVSSLDGSRVYACNGNNALSVFDTSSSTLISNITVSGHPIAIRLSKDGSLAYVSTWNTNSVAVIDLKNLRVIKIIPVGSAPRGIAITRDYGTLYVCNNGSDSVSVINTLTLTVTKTIPLGMNCYGGACSLDDNHLYICGQTLAGQGIVKQINVHSGAEVRVTSVIGYPRGIVRNHAGTHGYCCDKDTNTVSDIDLASGTVVRTWTVALGPLMIAITPDDKIGYVTCVYSSVLYVIPLDSGSGIMGAENMAGLGDASATTIRIVNDTPD